MKRKYLCRLVAMAAATAVAGATTVAQPVYAEGEIGTSTEVTSEPVVNETEQQTPETTSGAAVIIPEEPTGAVNESDFDFDPSTGTITGYHGSASEVDIPSTIYGVSVKNIGGSAFFRSDITRVVIPYGVVSIGEGAFSECSSLTSIKIPNSVTSIKSSAFFGCSNLTNIAIPDNLMSIEKYTFDGCSKLTSISIPSSVTSIGDYAFTGCNKLTYLEIPNGVQSIGEEAFGSCNGLISLTIPDSVTSIGNGAFDGCSNITSLTIPDSVTSIGDHAFEGCKSLADITIPNSVTSLGYRTFANCSSLTSIAIPSSVISVSAQVFDNCSNLKEIDVASENEKYKSIDGVLYNKAGDEIILYPIGKTEESYTIPDGVVYIVDEAFEDSNLKNVIIPNSVISIGWKSFGNCSKLESIVIPNSVTSIQYNTFRECSSLTSVTIPNSVTSIGYYAFDECDNAIFYVESENVKQLLINIGVDESKIVVNGQPPIVDTQTAGDLCDVINDGLNNFVPTNATTEGAVIAELDSFKKNDNLTITVSNFNKDNATTDLAGSINAEFLISNLDATDTATGYIQLVIPKLISSGTQTVNDLDASVKELLSNMDNVGNNADLDTILNNLRSLITNTDLNITIDNFQKTDSTSSSDGSITGTVVISNSSSDESTTEPLSLVIGKLTDEAQAYKDAVEAIDNYISNFKATNSTKEEDVSADVAALSSYSTISIRITGFNLVPATDTSDGSLEFTIELRDSWQTYSIDFSTQIPSNATSPVTSDDALRQELSNAVTFTSVSNATTEAGYTSGLKSNLLDNSIVLSLDSFTKVEATDTSDGYIHAVIRGTRADQSYVTLEIEKPIHYRDSSLEDENLLLEVEAIVSNAPFTKDVDEAYIKNLIETNLEEEEIDVDVSNLEIEAPTLTSNGALTCSVTLTRADGSVVKDILHGTILKSESNTAQTSSELNDAIKARFVGHFGSNDSTQLEVQDYLNGAITNNDLSAKITSFDMYKATTSAAGQIAIGYDINDNNGITQLSDRLTFIIPQLHIMQTYSDLNSDIVNALPSYIADNGVLQSDLQRFFDSYKTNSNLTVAINDFTKTEATTSAPGNIHVAYTITDSANPQGSVGFEYNIPIEKLQLNNEDQEIVDIAKNAVANMSTKNFTNQTDITVALLNGFSEKSYTIGSLNVTKFNKMLADTTNAGLVTAIVDITKLDGSVVTTNVQYILPVITQAEQDYENQVFAMQKYISYAFVPTNSTTESDVSRMIQQFITSTSTQATVTNFRVVFPATETGPGDLEFTVHVVDTNANASGDFNFAAPIPKLNGNQTEDEVFKIISETSVSNDTTAEYMQSRIQEKLSDQTMTATVSDFSLTEAKPGIFGRITFTLTIRKQDGTTSVSSFDKDILPLPTTDQTCGSLRLDVDQELLSYVATNDTTLDDIQTELRKLITNSDITLNINDFSEVDATEAADGSITGNVYIWNQKAGIGATTKLNLKIARLYSVSDQILINKCNTILNALGVSNLTASDDINEALYNGFLGSNSSARLTDITIVKATTTGAGVIKCTISINRGDNTYISSDIALPISKLTENEKAYEDTVERIQYFNEFYVPTNETTKESLLSEVEKLVTDSNMTVEIVEFNKKLANKSETGLLEFTVHFVDNSFNPASESYLDYSEEIPALGADSGQPGDQIDPLLLDTEGHIQAFLSKYALNNSSTADSVKAAIVKAIDDSRVQVSVQDYKLQASSYTSEGTCSFKIVLSFQNSSDTIDYSHGIAKLVSTGSGSSSGSSSHSSSGSSSNSSSTTTTGAQTTNTNNGTAVAGTTTSVPVATKPITTETGAVVARPISLDTITPEVAKAIEKEVVSNMSSSLGTGVIAQPTKEVVTAEGTKLAVTNVVKDGKTAGVVITAETSNVATIPVSVEEGQVTAVYKYVPLLGKYIEVKDAVIGADAITLPAQANATYIAAVAPLSTADTINEGWAKVDNNWYMVDKTGTPKTGWQKDSTGKWTFMDTKNAAMKTGWLKDGSNWYHLGDNGYMNTGWVNTGDGWYYLNQDGSMASNTTINGYKLGSNGAWIG